MLVVGPPDSLVINNKNSLKFLSTTKWPKPKTKRLYSLAKLASQYKYVISVFQESQNSYILIMIPTKIDESWTKPHSAYVTTPTNLLISILSPVFSPRVL